MKSKKCGVFLHGYLLCTVLGLLLLVPTLTLSTLLLIPGAFSVYLALGLIGFSGSGVLETISMVWLVLFPCAMAITYILALVKKWMLPFWVITCLDVLGVIGVAVMNLVEGDAYMAALMLADILPSIGFCAVFLAAIIRSKPQPGV